MSYTGTYPFTSVVRLLASFPGGGESQFSGALISPDEILTCAHGVWYSPDQLAATSIAVQLDTDQGSLPVTAAYVSDYHYNAVQFTDQGITTGQTVYDFALLHVPGGVFAPGGGSPVGGLGVYANFSGGTAAILGYPAQAGGYLSGDVEPVATDPVSGVLDFGYDGAVSPGSSGGPLLTELANGEFAVAGTVSTASTGPQITTADIGEIDSWLAADHEAPLLAATGVSPPDPIFNAAWYLAQNPDVARSGIDPYTHYMTFGWHEGRNPSPYFNTVYYLNQNPDVAAAGINPLTHFEQHGYIEGRDPSLDFSLGAYRAETPQLIAGVDPLVDFLQSGLALGRMAFSATPHATGPQDALVSDSYYFGTYTDVAAAGIDPTVHYDTWGWHELRNPDALFNTAYYLAQNPDVAASGLNPMLHYEEFGWHEGRNPSAAFDTGAYLEHNPDMAAAGIDPLVHYLDFGMAEGRAIYAVPGQAGIG